MVAQDGSDLGKDGRKHFVEKIGFGGSSGVHLVDELLQDIWLIFVFLLHRQNCFLYNQPQFRSNALQDNVDGWFHLVQYKESRDELV